MSRKEAIATFLKASKLMEAKQYEEAEKLYLSVQRELADVPALYYNLAQVYYKINQNNSALKQIEEALVLDPNNAKYLTLEFKILQNLSLFEDAIDIAERIEQLDYNPDVVINKGFLYLRTGQIEKAVATFDELLKQGSNDAVVYFTLGILKYQSKQYKIAEGLIREAIKQEYQVDEARQILVNILEQDGRMSDAITELENLKIKTVNNEFSLARMYKNEGRMDQALNKIDQLLQEDGSNIDYLNFKGHVLRENHQFNDAIKMYDKVLSMDNDDLSAIKGKALCLVELDRHDEANKLFDRGEKLNRGGEMPNFDDLVMNLDVL